MMAIARDRGIPTSIYRPTWIEGQSRTGVCNRSDFLRSLIKGCIQLGLAPNWNMPVDIVPVDYISQAIAHLSRQKTSLSKVFHISNPRSMAWNQLVNWMCDFGYSLQQVPYSQWITEVMNRVPSTPDNALHPFFAFLSEKIPEQQMSVPEIYFVQTESLQYDCQNTLNALADTDITCPPVDDKLLRTYFSYFIHSGFLTPPYINSRPLVKVE